MSETHEKESMDRNTTVLLALKSWDRFKTPNFRVDPGLLGAFHSFVHQGRQVKVSLPQESEVNNTDRVKVDCWRGGDREGEMEPLNYLIHSVDVSGVLPGETVFPSAVLAQPANALDLFTPEEQERLELLAATSGQLALAAFDLWIRCVRWKSGLSRFGRAATMGPETGWGNSLRDARTGNSVWLGKHRFVSPARSAISPVHWGSIGSALAAGESPPVFVDLLFDAEMHIEAGDFRRAVIDAAVAAETYVRTVVRSTLPSGLGRKAAQVIERQNIGNVLEHLFPEALALLGKPGYKPPSELKDMLITRNSIMHSGHVDDLSREKCPQLCRGSAEAGR